MGVGEGRGGGVFVFVFVSTGPNLVRYGSFSREPTFICVAR